MVEVLEEHAGDFPIAIWTFCVQLFRVELFQTGPSWDARDAAAMNGQSVELACAA